MMNKARISIEKYVVKLECGKDAGNALIIDECHAITIRHCINDYIENKACIKLLYGGDQSIALSAVVDHPERITEEQIVVLHFSPKIDIPAITLYSYMPITFEYAAAFGFDKNHNERAIWHELKYVGPDGNNNSELINDLIFRDNSKEKSMGGLSGSPVIDHDERNVVYGLIAHERLESGSSIDLEGISFSSQTKYLDSELISISVCEKVLSETSSEMSLDLDGTFMLTHPFSYYGHGDDIRRVLKWLDNNRIILIHGEAGIGKTEFCRAVLEKLKRKSRINAINMIECREYRGLLSRVAGVSGICLPQDCSEKIAEKMVLSELNGILYLDNFEDILSETNKEKSNRDKAINFLRKCFGNDRIKVLISSRAVPQTDFCIKTLPLPVLDDTAAVALFCDISGEGPDEDIKSFVLNELYKFPLAIVLAAKQWRYNSTISELRDIWRNARQNVKYMENPRHVTLRTALDITYNEVKKNASLRYLWEVFTLFPDAIHIKIVKSVIPDFYDAQITLIDLSVIHRNGDYLSMLPPLKEYIKEADEYTTDIETVSEKLLEYYSTVFNPDRKTERGTVKDTFAVSLLTEAFYYMNEMIEADKPFVVEKMHKLLHKYYMEKPYEAVIVVSKANDRIHFGDKHTEADIKRYYGDLERRIDYLAEAEGHYCEAEKICKEINYYQGLANVLQSMGDLEMRRASLVKSERHYCEAEELYRKIYDDQGLANVLQSMGDLEKRRNNLAKSEEHYREAEELYRKINDDLGLANVLQSMGDLEMRRNNLAKAEGHYRKAEELYRKINDDQGLANVLQSMGDLERSSASLAKAEGYYRKAEELYRKIHDDLGLANVLQSMGDLEMRRNNLAKAEGHYRKAEELCRKIYYGQGLADVLRAMGDLEKRRDKLDKAKEYFCKAEELHRGMIHDNLGLANVLWSMGDLERRRENLVKAEEYFCEAEELYRKIHEDQGLANVLWLMGNLEMRRNNLAKAEEYFCEAEELYRKIHEDQGLANVLWLMGSLEMCRINFGKAEEYFCKAEELYRKIHDDQGLANVLRSMSDLERYMDKLGKAEDISALCNDQPKL